MSDEARKHIMARRARFVAAALASLATDACGKTTAAPDAAVEVDAPVPMPCLTVTAPLPEPPPPDDAAPPTPCLSVRPPVSAPRPQPCLKAPPPPKCDPPFTIDKDGKKRFKPECL